MGHVDHQGGDRDDTDVCQMLERLFEHLLTFGEVEEGLALLRVAQRGHHHFVEKPGGAFDDFEVSVVDRVERPGNERDPHETPFSATSSGRATVTMVPPYRLDFMTPQPCGGVIATPDSRTARSPGRFVMRDSHPSKSYGGSHRMRS